MPDLTRMRYDLATASTERKKGKGAELILLKTETSNTYTALGEAIRKGWKEETLDLRASGGKVLRIIKVYDLNKARRADLLKCTALGMKGKVYKFAEKREPTGLTQEWYFEVQGTGAEQATIRV